ncbi:MAG: hypothetical protein LBT05_04780 [Planctomycetaceae bacterium]|jgi:hypothetical protein|nr:hypothetical protein [Planctomycetaceae bacterium]
MAKQQYKQFSNLSLLRRFNFELLLQFLAPYRDYLCSKDGFQWTENLLTFPYQKLMRILAVPDDDMPEMLHNGLFFIDELSTPKGIETILARLKDENLLPPDLSREDIVLYAWLVDPKILQSTHSEFAGFRVKKTEHCFSRKPLYPDVSQERLIALEDDLNDWFDSINKGRGVQVMVYERGGTIWFHLRRGELLKNDCDLKNNGQIKRIVYRPERYDVVGYTPCDCEFEIHSETKREKNIYCKLFGKHLFNDENFILSGDKSTRYTLSPLKERGRDALACGDVDGMDWARLTELQAMIPGKEKYREVYKSENGLFEDWGTLAPQANKNYSFVLASFLLRFTDLIRPKTLTICTPNVAIFERGVQSDMIMKWLKTRGFITV